MTAALEAAISDKIVRQGFSLPAKTLSVAGRLMLRLAVRDNVTGKIGTIDTTLLVPAEQPQKTP